MAGKRRTIDPELLQHPLFRRAGFIERELWIGLIVMADDEGRLRADPLTLAETIFSPLCHQVTEAAVDAALDYWAEAGWLLRYDGNAFLTGWYEHQYIQERTRDDSGIAAPPCTLNSWAVADRIFDWYAASGSKAKTYYRRALRAFAALSDEEQSAIARGANSELDNNQFRTGSEPVPLQTEQNGTERNRNGTEGGRAREAAPASDGLPLGTVSSGDVTTADTAPADDPADADHMAACNEPALVAAATRYFADTLSPQRATAWAMDALRLTLLPGETVTRDDITAALGNGSGPVGREVSFPANWLDRLRGARASPSARSDAGWRIPDRSEYPDGEFKL